MLILNFDPFPILQTERLVLRKITLQDAPEIFIQRSHPTIQKYIKREPARSVADAEEHIVKITQLEKIKKSITWAITIKGDHKLIGSICLWNIEPELNKAEVGYSLHPDYYNKGIMSEALQKILNYGFEKMQLTTIDAYTHKENTASLMLLKKNGFVRNLDFEESMPDKTELEYNQVHTLSR